MAETKKLSAEEAADEITRLLGEGKVEDTLRTDPQYAHLEDGWPLLDLKAVPASQGPAAADPSPARLITPPF